MPVAALFCPSCYPRLFRAFVQEYNWGYADRWEEIPMVQHSFLFTLHLLNKYGAEWRSSRFYEDSFLQAFPMVLREVPPMGEYYSPEKSLRSCYSWRCMERFARFMGLAEIERDPAGRYSEDFRLRNFRCWIMSRIFICNACSLCFKCFWF